MLLEYSLDGFKGKSTPETMVFTMKYGGFRYKFSLKPTQWNMLEWNDDS
jgi:hypothetical protein